VTKNLCAVLFIILIIASVVSPKTAVSGDGRYVAEYINASLNREFDIGSCPETMKKGLLTGGGEDLTDGGEEIIDTPSNVSGVCGVEIADIQPCSASGSTGSMSEEPKRRERAFLPKMELFAPLLADPRWPHFSAAYLNFMEGNEFENVGSVSFGESFSLCRKDFPPGGEWELGIEAAVFSIFDLDAASHDLINSDFWVAFPYISCRDGSISALWRLFHQSSHIGDEYLLRSRVDRVNLSYEGLDLKISYDFLKEYRIYGGSGYLFHRDPPDLEPWLIQFGFEFECSEAWLGEEGRPVAAMNLQYTQENDWDTDLSLRLGVKFKALEPFPRNYLLVLEYYNGHSPHGQFYETNIEYMGIGTHIYF
jgi:hypothetical protein